MDSSISTNTEINYNEFNNLLNKVDSLISHEKKADELYKDTVILGSYIKVGGYEKNNNDDFKSTMSIFRKNMGRLPNINDIDNYAYIQESLSEIKDVSKEILRIIKNAYRSLYGRPSLYKIMNSKKLSKKIINISHNTKMNGIGLVKQIEAYSALTKYYEKIGDNRKNELNNKLNNKLKSDSSLNNINNEKEFKDYMDSLIYRCVDNDVNIEKITNKSIKNLSYYFYVPNNERANRLYTKITSNVELKEIIDIQDIYNPVLFGEYERILIFSTKPKIINDDTNNSNIVTPSLFICSVAIAPFANEIRGAFNNTRNPFNIGKKVFNKIDDIISFKKR